MRKEQGCFGFKGLAPFAGLFSLQKWYQRFYEREKAQEEKDSIR